jgi:predicted acylesterase/phospholipase RssA
MSVASASPARLALSISGGGHRAAAFGLGTIALLQEIDVMERVTVISTVSGGSLAGAFYLGAKAAFLDGPGDTAAELRAWRERGFRQKFVLPLLEFLHGMQLAEQLVAHVLPVPLAKGSRLIRRAADRVDQLLRRFGYPTRLGAGSIRNLLKREGCSPDQVFVNAADLTTLDLFRFGVDRQGGPGGSFVINRYRIPAEPGPADSPALQAARTLAQDLRIADCVAASFCFPGGFEPLLFPDDFLNGGSPDGEGRPTQAALEARRRLCGGLSSLALMDGGLYDNLGLASVEMTLLELREREAQELDIAAEAPDRRRGRIYVLATDVDNIQPANKFLDPARQDPPDQSRGSRPRQNWLGWLRAAVLPAALSAALAAFALLLLPALPLLLLLFAAGRLPLLRWPLLAWAHRSPWLAGSLGALGIELDPPRSPQPADGGQSVSLVRVTAALRLWSRRRLEVLLPAFNGYLKRTRNLTYQFLAYKYDHFNQRNPNTFLLRNLIFELAPGIDVDRDEKLDELTQPLVPFAAPGELSRPPSEEWIQPKLARIKRLLAHLHKDPVAPLDDQRRALLAELNEDLRIDAAAERWRRIGDLLENPAAAAPLAAAEGLDPHSESLDCLWTVVRAIHHALPPEAQEEMKGNALLARICEMGTNLPTTLWLEHFRCYLPNTYSSGRIDQSGGWFTDERRVPPGSRDHVLVFSRGVAVDVAVAAGYINTCFNLLEFSSSRLGLAEGASP